jgi:ketosteroid isomerase-like protein
MLKHRLKDAVNASAKDQLAAEHLIWLKQFAAAVRNRDFALGRKLCDDDIVGFGTVAFRADCLDELFANQWQVIWTSTKDFDFDYATASSQADTNMAVLMATWHSIGVDKCGMEFPRSGRATVVLKRHDDEWRAVHTHFSMEPKS